MMNCLHPASQGKISVGFVNKKQLHGAFCSGLPGLLVKNHL